MGSVDVLRTLFEQHFGSPPTRVEELRGQLGASARRMLRLSGRGATAMGVLYDVREENMAFVEFSRHFRRHGLPVPRIYEADLDHNAYLEEDLGDTTLFEFLVAHRQGAKLSPEVQEVYLKVAEILPRFQVEAGRDLDYSVCYPRSSFDRQSIAWDLNSFKYYFLQATGVPFKEQALEDDFVRLGDSLMEAERDHFLYRDFQSRNIMLPGGMPAFIDYQGGRKGALQYDIASLLYDAKADLPPSFRQQILTHYLDALTSLTPVHRVRFMDHFYPYVYIRIMQALGAYGFRGFFERKPHFLQSVPFAVENLAWLLDNTDLPVPLPELTRCFREMQSLECARPAGAGLTSESTDHLSVRISSFSFHRDAVEDESGNGGGFVFDARSLPNPGRVEAYRDLTGRDLAVADYLDRDAAVGEYMSRVFALVDASVAAYQRRGFGSLMVSFGCTGGQHRSVFMAERLAVHLRGREGVRVDVRHLGLERLGRS